jgi:hypothetical protein
MGANYDPATYVPGAAWTNKDFFSSALTPPRLSLTAVATNGTTTGSYFEYRGGPGENDKTMQVIVSGSGTAMLQASFDDGSTWVDVKAYTAPSSEDYRVGGVIMYRLKSLTGTPNLALIQPS